MHGDQDGRGIDRLSHRLRHRVVSDVRIVHEGIKGRCANLMNPPRLFAHPLQPAGRFGCGDHVDRSKLSQSVANGVIDHAQTGLTAFNVNNGNPHRHGGDGGRKHFKTIGRDQSHVGPEFRKALRKTQLGPPARSRHVHIAVSTQARNAMRHFVAFCFNFGDRRAVVVVHHRGRGHQDGFQF